MTLQINGEPRPFDDAPTPFTLVALLDRLAMKADRIAVELNLDIVPRDRWSTTELRDGDKLEIVHFVGGGLSPDFRLLIPATDHCPQELP